jgi:hypothetical protein
MRISWLRASFGSVPDDVSVLLLNVFAKGEKVDLSKAERNELKKILADIADVYRRTAAETRR